MASDPQAPRPADRRVVRFLSWLVALGILYLAGTFVDVWWAARSDSGDVVEAAVVLGAAQYNGVPSPALAGRLDHAAALYASGQVEVIVVTGGAQEGDATTEAKAGYDYLRAAGIPDEDLKLEVDGTSTYESLAATARFLRLEEISDVVLVTDPYHARRSQLVAAELGLHAEVSPTDAPATFGRLTHETLAVAVGRIIGFRRLERLA